MPASRPSDNRIIRVAREHGCHFGNRRRSSLVQAAASLRGLLALGAGGPPEGGPRKPQFKGEQRAIGAPEWRQPSATLQFFNKYRGSCHEVRRSSAHWEPRMELIGIRRFWPAALAAGLGIVASLAAFDYTRSAAHERVSSELKVQAE